MASLKIVALCMLAYALLFGKYWFVLWAIIVWEIAGGFHGSTVLWISNFDDDHGS